MKISALGKYGKRHKFASNIQGGIMPGISCIPNLEHGSHLQGGWAGQENLLWTDQSGSGGGGT